MNILFLYIINHIYIYIYYYIKLGVIMDNKVNSLLLKNIHKWEYKSRIKIFINFKMQYYYLEYECSLCFVKWYSSSLVLVSLIVSSIFFFLNFKKDNWDTYIEVSEECQVFGACSTRIWHPKWSKLSNRSHA